MSVLVTGAGGFLGGALVERLLVRGEKDVRCFMRTQTNRSALEALAQKHPGARVQFITGNLMSPSDIETALKGVDTVYHLAAGMSGAPADLFLNTVVASKNLLEAAKDLKSLRIVLVSSFGVYGVADLPRGSVLDERTALEPHPEKRDPYSYAKLRQELLFREYQSRYGFELVVLRPGVVYGPGGGAFSARVGLALGPLFLHLGGGNKIPLTFVENCADAIVVAGQSPKAAGEAFNVHDDDLPTSRQYLKAYKRDVRPVRSLRIPYWLMQLISRAVARYHVYSRGQMPAVFTPYKTATLWKGTRFSNEKLKAIGWQPLVPTQEGLRRTFEYARNHQSVR